MLKDSLGQGMARDVVLTLFADEGPASKKAADMLGRLASLDERIKVVVEFDLPPGIERRPAIRLGGNIIFYGIPAKYEFQPFVEAIVMVSSGESGVDESLVGDVRAVEGRLLLFVTSDCPACPEAAELFYGLAVENPHIRVEVISLEEFPELAEDYGIMGSPTVVAEGGRIDGQVPDEMQIISLLKGKGPK
jgi:alkyl hydroperoxide reductase subunit AhpF